jgi:transcriptional regulator with XRE-family HTH domain
MKDAKIESQSQLARLSGVPQATISRILKGQGRQGPETVTLVALAKALNVEVKWLQEGPGAKESAQDEPLMRVVETSIAPKLQWITDREAALLSEFRACAEPQRERLLAAARGMPKDARRAPSKKA